jgi:N-carbamoyl-L-amino-acid hydrolase
MSARHDAQFSASRLTLAADRIATEMEVCRVATVGSAQVHPNAVNVVPGRVQLGLEFRDERMESLAAAEVELRRAAMR